ILPDDLKRKLNRGAILSVSVSSMNQKITNILEPGAATPEERLEVMHQLKQQGFLAGINAIPTLPFLSDTEEELERTISAAKKHETGSFELAEELWESGALEEKIIAIKILEKIGKSDPDKLLRLFKGLSKEIDNWAVCDGLGMQVLRSIVRTHQQQIFDLAK